jgi:ABC-type transport system substrate-binding protein
VGYTERAMSAGGQRQIELGRKIVRVGAGRGLSCLALALLLGGCSGGEAEPERGRGDRTTEDPARERATSASDEVIDDAALASALTGASGPTETVVIAVRTLPEALDPLAELDPWGTRACEDLLFEGLVRRWPEGHPWIEPALADRCEAGQGGREVLCHLRADRRFHDGEPVSVEDVLYSLSAWTGAKGGAAAGRARARGPSRGERGRWPGERPRSGPVDPVDLRCRGSAGARADRGDEGGAARSTPRQGDGVRS